MFSPWFVSPFIIHLRAPDCQEIFARCRESPTAKILSDWPEYDPAKHKTMLFATDGAGKITGQADTYGRFSAAGNTQRNLDAYVMFSLGGTAEAETKIWSMGTEGAHNTSVFYKKDGSRYVRE